MKVLKYSCKSQRLYHTIIINMARKKLKVIDLSKILPSYDGKWVALDKKNQIVTSAKSFNQIIEKTKDCKNLKLMPAAKNYFGFVG